MGDFIVGDTHTLEEGAVLYPGHPLVEAAISQTRDETSSAIRALVTTDPLPGMLQATAGRRAKLVVSKLRYRGLVPVDRLVVTLLPEGELDPIEDVSVGDLLDLALEAAPDIAPALTWDAEVLDESIEECVLNDQAEVRDAEDRVLERKLDQLDRYIEDQIVVLKRQESVQLRAMEECERKRAKASSPTALDVAEPHRPKRSVRSLPGSKSASNVFRPATTQSTRNGGSDFLRHDTSNLSRSIFCKRICISVGEAPPC